MRAGARATEFLARGGTVAETAASTFAATFADAPASILADTVMASAVDRAQQLRVLIYSADLGGGHDAMANAIKGELLTRFPGQVHVEVANGLQIGNPIMHRLMRDGYSAQLKYAPGTYGAMYELATKPGIAKFAEKASSAFTGRRLAEDIARRDPDVVLSTFPQLTGTLGHLRADGRLKVPAIGVVIDSDPHRQWVSALVDDHLVLNPKDLPRIASFGTEAAPITGRAIRPPVDPRSFEHYDVAAARAEFGLPLDEKVVIVSGGAWGLALPEAELHRILRDTDLHLAIATGRNEQAFNHLKATFPADRVTPIPFTREMPKLLAASDGMLTNSAGMTTMEGFARGRPIVLYRPVPGHGVDGAEALAEDGLATYATSPDTAIAALRRIEAGTDADMLARVARGRALFDEGEYASDVVMDAAHVGSTRSGPAPT
ncbi:MAG: putative UDP-glucuronosyltransferase [Thermoleophilia bacterium]|nr:putative UDP-glucuronosyltransferase [Thermoleophilia bacterium]